ncbi:MAG: hypothetical protein UU88_C0015G0024 [Parcubacteria group bacterium GW2011_GWC1_42_11]|uniref:Uncharacterized protein n=1 Tax=Candidatus Nomurabacteria bacterium GW2011_GWC2_42_20 TaxID=1618756 RepID=A0A0G0ZHH5_9BACT|nr:MAG: hypothetical protein UU88_C0015G0024 [Parcubacteria group bacterium GW2011_GWC1_42_11]KKS48180.1 MAG: hypothetical protein UV12_C0002G0029 [Candidatus Nomurabacteria bacterium GW2011_GWC2_42_20]KKT08500.1 MAG: hypothetical protein UV86_C0018G0004 [Candidatus Nomurabacteria bacterium GW2011_GWB1_43_20]KKU36838.1 MAG: hypothetical protein UX52_C0038G0004 [Candidatus Amesbacteria bacterium GW2011_GWA1_46_35]TAN37127.1 MAG: hypothetical protein EPN27_00070 [Patescibacteria group bacterium]
MKVLSIDDGQVLIEFDNLVQYTNVVGVTEPVRAMVPVAMLPGLEKFRQAGQEAAQRFNQVMADIPYKIH